MASYGKWLPMWKWVRLIYNWLPWARQNGLATMYSVVMGGFGFSWRDTAFGDGCLLGAWGEELILRSEEYLEPNHNSEQWWAPVETVPEEGSISSRNFTKGAFVCTLCVGTRHHVSFRCEAFASDAKIHLLKIQVNTSIYRVCKSLILVKIWRIFPTYLYTHWKFRSENFQKGKKASKFHCRMISNCLLNRKQKRNKNSIKLKKPMINSKSVPIRRSARGCNVKK